MTDAGEAARRIVKAFTTGGAYKGDDYATWWGGGDRWMNYMFGLDPADYAHPIDQPQMSVLKKWMQS